MKSLINIYRISEESSGYKKTKPLYISNKNCLQNFVNVFGVENLYIFADNTTTTTDNMIEQITGTKPIKISTGSSGASFRYIYEWCLNQKFNDDTIIYFIESDYIHKKGSKDVLIEGVELGSDFVCLYDHPDRYIDAKDGGNPEIEGGGEITKVFKTYSCWWKLSNSTTMSFVAKISTLKEYSYIIRKHTNGTYPTDYQMFVDLRTAGASLISPIPSYSTHGETQWLSVPREGKIENLELEWKKIINC